MEGANYYRLNKEFDLVTSNCLVWRIEKLPLSKMKRRKEYETKCFFTSSLQVNLVCFGAP